MEYLNLYDREGNLLNKKGVRGIENSDLIGIVIIFIENSFGEFLIQKTSKAKYSQFATTGGHVSYGYTFKETIINEVKEELGVDISKDEVIEAQTYFRKSYIQKVYYLKKDIDIKDIKVQESEVEFVQWLNKDTINNLIKHNEFRESNIEGYKYIINNYK